MTGVPKHGCSVAGAASLNASAAHVKRKLSPEILTGLIKAGDICVIILMGFLAYYFYVKRILNSDAGLDHYLFVILFVAFSFSFTNDRFDGYRFKNLLNLYTQTVRIIISFIGIFFSLLALAFLLKISDLYSRVWAAAWISTSVSLLVAERIALWLSVRGALLRDNAARRVAVIGAGEEGERLVERLMSSGAGIVIVGVFDDRKTRVDISKLVVGTTDDLLAVARNFAVDEIIIALPLNAVARIGELVQKLLVLPVDLRLSVDALATAFPVRGLTHFGEVPIIELADRPLKHWSAVAKWLEDKTFAAILVMLTAPLMLVIAGLIKLDSRGPAFFVQERFGFDNDVVRVIKFRTMFIDRSDFSGGRQTSRGDPRVTRVGRFLRAFSFDELPQLFNVLRGDMSLVGPRAHPIGMRIEGALYHDLVKDYPRRHRVKPGITGWAQINGSRGAVNTVDKAQKRVAYDLYYIENWSLWLDIKIIILSLQVFFSRKNAF